MKDVYLGKGHFEIFYFYVTDMDKKLALIGNDLTSYYTYRHDRKSDIIISGFDYEGYSNEFKSRNPKILDLDTLLSG